jgi:hypothetical protein
MPTTLFLMQRFVINDEMYLARSVPLAPPAGPCAQLAIPAMQLPMSPSDPSFLWPCTALPC